MVPFLSKAQLIEYQAYYEAKRTGKDNGVPGWMDPQVDYFNIVLNQLIASLPD